MKNYNLAVLGGDGIGPEVTAQAQRVMQSASEKYGFGLTWTELPYGSAYYLKNKIGIPESGFKEIAQHDAMLLGAIGDPRIPPGPLEQEILLALRFHFDQYINLRPSLSFPGIPLPVQLRPGEKLDVLVVRENTEDLYMGMGGSGTGSYETDLEVKRGLYTLKSKIGIELPADEESAFSIGLMSRKGIERVTHYACRQVKARGEKMLTVVSKANAVPHLYGFWDKVTREVVEKSYPGMEYWSVNVDAVTYLMARNPAAWGVVLCPNLFGDIVSDLMSGLAGGLGLAAAGNIGDGLAMFEPVHGSAPTIAGTGQANPLAAIMSGSMLLEHIGEKEAARDIDAAVRSYLSSGLPRPVEQGGQAVTEQVGDFVASFVRQ